MEKIICKKGFLFCAVLLMLGSVCYAQQKIVVVSPLLGKNAITAEDAEALTDLFNIALDKTRSVVRVTRDFSDIEREMNFQLTDWSNPKKTTDFGKILTADYVVTWKVNVFRKQVRITGEVLDVREGKFVGSDDLTEDPINIDDIPYYLGPFAENLVKRMSSIKNSMPIRVYGDRISENEERSLQSAVQQALQKCPVSAGNNAGFIIRCEIKTEYSSTAKRNMFICDVSIALTQDNTITLQSETKRITGLNRDIVIRGAVDFIRENSDFFQSASR